VKLKNRSGGRRWGSANPVWVKRTKEKGEEIQGFAVPHWGGLHKIAVWGCYVVHTVRVNGLERESDKKEKRV